MAGFDVKTAYADDYQWFDAPETVQVTSKNPTGSTDTIVRVIREPRAYPQIGSADTLGTEHPGVVFHLWESEIHSIALKNGDSINQVPYLLDEHGDPVLDENGDPIPTGPDVGWTIQSLTNRQREPRWRAVCTRRVS